MREDEQLHVLRLRVRVRWFGSDKVVFPFLLPFFLLVAIFTKGDDSCCRCRFRSGW